MLYKYKYYVIVILYIYIYIYEKDSFLIKGEISLKKKKT